MSTNRDEAARIFEISDSPIEIVKDLRYLNTK